MVALLVALTFIGFLVVDVLARKSRTEDEVIDSRNDLKARPQPAFPMGYFFSPGHVWVNLLPSGNLKLGWDELVQSFMGKNSTLFLKKPGDTVKKGDALAVVSHSDQEVFIKSPIDGQIVQTNTELEENPDSLSGNPYEAGWFYQLEPTHLSQDLSGLKISQQARSWLADEFSRLKDFVHGSLPEQALACQTLTDGGVLVDGLVDHLDEQGIKKFEQQFLTMPEENN